MKRQATMRQHGRLLTLLRYAWASPCSLVGVLLAAPILLMGGRAHLHTGVLEVALPGQKHPPLDLGAITLGHVVLGGSERTLCQLPKAVCYATGRWRPRLPPSSVACCCVVCW